MTFFWSIYRIFKKQRIIFSLSLVVLLLVSAFYASQLQFTEDITKMLPNSRNLKQFSFVYSNSKFLDKLVFNISLKDSTQDANPKLLSQFADDFSLALEHKFKPSHIQSVQRLPDSKAMQEIWDYVMLQLPLFLEEEDYEAIDSILNPDAMAALMKSHYHSLISPVGMMRKKQIAKDPLQLSFMALNKFRTFQAGDNYSIYNNHILSSDHKNLILVVAPNDANNTAMNRELKEGIDELLASFQTSTYGDVQAQYFGNAVVALGNAERIKSDIILTLSLALAFLVVFISLFFRRIASFFLVFGPVLFGALISLACLYIFKKEVSAISLGIGSVLLGISVDYALHILSHYRKYGDVQRLLKDIATPILLSSLTTSTAFLILHFTDSKALNDLGLFAAISVLAAAVFSVFVLPQLLGKAQKQSKATSIGPIRWVDLLSKSGFASNKYVKLSIVVLTLIFLFTSQNVGFDADMMKANYMSDDLRRAEMDLNRVTSLSKKTIFIVAPGKTMEEALRNNEESKLIIDSLIHMGLVSSATNISSVFKSEQKQIQAIERWNSFWEDRSVSTMQFLKDAASPYGFNTDAFGGFEEMLTKTYEPVAFDQLGVFENMGFSNYQITTDTLKAVINVLKVENDPAQIDAVHKSFENIPFAWVIDKQSLTSASVTSLKDIFDQLIRYSLVLVFIILLIAYGRIELTLITMIPIVISWIWTVGLMGLFGISFNIFNVVILTFIFGLGIDYSIFIMRGLIQHYKYGTSDLSSYKVSVILSGITTMAGIGVLIFAQHPALKSIALMSIIGILSVIFITFSLLPSIFKWLVSYQEGLRNRPVTLVDFLFSIMSLLIFMSGAILMTSLSFIIKPLPIAERKKKYFFHWMFSRATRILIRANVLSKEHYENKEIADYSKPAVIIANHQSHIDLMLMMLIDPRVIVLTNRRNYYNPVYGRALQYADFQLSDEDNESMIASLAQKVANGYSILVFPEGTRSGSGRIKRFHKGAFHIARELGIDIQPIIIHGQGQLLKKSEFFLKRGNVVTRFLPRIDLSKNEFGTSLRDQTKGVQEYFRSEFYKVKRRVETTDFFKDYIKKNYLYKGPVLEWYTKVKLGMEGNYQFFDDLIPRECSITDLGCGYGYLDYMLAMISEDRTITAVDYDEEKIGIARNCAIQNERVEFICEDISSYDLSASDVFILNDVLHYLPSHMQIDLLAKCEMQLNEGGMIIVRDGSRDLEKRHKITRFTEFLSTGIGFNKTRFALEFLSRDEYQAFADDKKLAMEVVDKEDATSNLVFIFRNESKH